MPHGQRASGLINKLKELWGKRPMANYGHSAENKRLCRRIERRKAKQELERNK